MKLSALQRKLLRDLWTLKGQALAIALVLAAGVAMLVMYRSTFASLSLTQETYYQRQRFADVFASLERAPRSLEQAISEIPGVATSETRVVRGVTLDLPEEGAPAAGRLISIPPQGRPRLNDLALQAGRFPEAGRPDEVIASADFAKARGLGVGDQVVAVLDGSRRSLEIVGLALSPEYVYSIRPGDLFPDPARYGIFWMERRALAAAFDLEGAFNDVALKLARGAREEEVIAHLDRLLEPYGGLGAIPRSLQTSHWYLENELMGLEGAGSIVPVIFLAVAAFLLNVVLKRIVSVQREQIAALKALGYSNWDIGFHYAQWSLLVAFLGATIGSLGGAWMGQGMTQLYTMYYNFPLLQYRVEPAHLLVALAVSVVAALLGSRGAVLGAIRLPPAEAMRPEPPASFRPTLVERLGLRRFLSEPVRMILRHLERQPWRAGLSMVGIAFAGASMVVGSFAFDAVEVMLDTQFSVAQRQDATVTFQRPVSGRALYEIESLPGVLAVEPVRSVAVRLTHGHRSRQVGLQGVLEGARLQRVIDGTSKPVSLPPEGLVLSSALAEVLGAGPGDEVFVEVLEGARPVRTMAITGVVEEAMGTAAYLDMQALHVFMREAGSLSGVVLQMDPAAEEPLFRRLKATPAVAGMVLRARALETVESTMAQNLNLVTFFNVLFASVIAFGVIYNNARISLSERSRDLASLRVLGFTRGEISFILLGELAVVTLAAIPMGLLLGRGMAVLVVKAFENELYRMPLVISPRTYAVAALTVLVASAVSALVVRRRLDRLDLIAVLKTRE